MEFSSRAGMMEAFLKERRARLSIEVWLRKQLGLLIIRS
jgi:hypothetical protein